MSRSARAPWPVALGIYLFVTVVTLAAFAPERLRAHTPYNHFALLADAWIHGRLDLGGPPPPYTGNNDFAVFQGKTYVSFPPLPAVLIAPVVAMAGSAEKVADGRFFAMFAGLGPALLFLALDKLSRRGRSALGIVENAGLALLFALGSVYWFSAVQGTVWFAAHVIGVAAVCGYILASIEAEHPAIAGLALALAFATRTPAGFALPFFLVEAYRAASREGSIHGADEVPPPVFVGTADARALLRSCAIFATPALLVLAALLWHNRVRFGDPFEFGHRMLAIGWRPRIDKWGLFSYHYLGRNLSIVLASLPYTRVTGAPFQINIHGLALWVTSPWVAWALWPRRARAGFFALAVTALAVAAPSLLYQNSGWAQFGYRFSNDFMPFVVVMIALSGRRLSALFWILGAVAVAVNAFGAFTFDRADARRFYFVDPTQRTVHQPD